MNRRRRTWRKDKADAKRVFVAQRHVQEAERARQKMAGKIVKVLIGALLLLALVGFEDALGGIRTALAKAGWLALVAISAWQLAPTLLCSLAWWGLREAPVSEIARFLVGRWVRDSIDTLISIVPFSGEFAAAQLFARYGRRTVETAALIVADLTCEISAQVLFSAGGIGLWLLHYPSGEVVRWSVIGVLIGIPAIAGFVLVQRSGVLVWVDSLAKRLPRDWRGESIGSAIHTELSAIYACRGRILLSIGLHLAAWTASAGEAFIGLRFLGHPLPPVDVLAMETVIFAIRSASFLVPASLGLQEGGYVLVGAVLGLPPDIALAVSLLKRGRELAVGLPALVVWQGAGLAARRAGGKAHESE